MEHSFEFLWMLLLYWQISTKSSFPFLLLLLLFKTPLLSTTKSCMCEKWHKTKTPSMFYWARATRWDLSKHTISGEIWAPGLVNLSLCLDQPQPIVFHCFTWEQPAVRTRVGWVGASCFLILLFPAPRKVKCSLSIGCLELQYLSIGGNLVFCLCKKKPLLLMKRVRGQHLLNHS